MITITITIENISTSDIGVKLRVAGTETASEMETDVKEKICRAVWGTVQSAPGPKTLVQARHGKITKELSDATKEAHLKNYPNEG